MKLFYLNTIFLAIISCFLWSTAFVGIKYGLQFTTPLRFAGIRFFISGLLIFPFYNGGVKKYFSLSIKNFKIILAIAFLQTFFQYSMFYIGLNKVPASLGAIIIGSGPLFIAMIAHLLTHDDQLTLKRFMIFLLGVAGIIVVTAGRNNFSLSGEVKLSGILLLLFSILIGGIANVIVSKDQENVPPLLLSSSSMIIGGASLFLFSGFLEGFSLTTKPLEYYIALGWLSFLSATAVSIWFVLLKRPGVKVSSLNFWKFIIPVSGALLSWIILPDEKPNVIAFIGMGIIAFAIILMNIHNRNLKNNELLLSQSS